MAQKTDTRSEIRAKTSEPARNSARLDLQPEPKSPWDTHRVPGAGHTRGKGPAMAEQCSRGSRGGHPAFLQHQQSGARLPARPAERSSRDRHCKPRTRPKMQPHPLRQRPRLLRAVHSGREAPPPAAALRGVPVTLSSQSREQRRGRPAKSRGRASGAVHGELSSACPTVGWDVRAWGRSAEPRKRSVVGCAAPRTPRTAPRAPRPGLTPTRTARRAEGARTGRRRPLRASALRSARGAGPHQRPNTTPSPASRGTRGHSGKEGTLRGC